MGLFQPQLLVHFQVLLNVQLTIEILHAHVMHIEVMPSRNRPHPIENILSRSRPWDGMNHHVGVGEDLLNRSSDFVSHLPRALKSNITRESHGNISKVAVARTADANPADLQK